MSSPSNASGTSDILSRGTLPSPLHLNPPTRKAPPSPLSISTSSLSPRAILSSNAKNGSNSSSPNGRNSLESSRSDLTSVRSDVTSLHCSEFPAPPATLPPIPASPRTPRSLYFSTTPTTPRSRSPQSDFALPMQEPPRSGGRTILGSPSSLKALFSGSSSPASVSKFASQQDHHPPPKHTEPQASRSVEDLKLGYERSRLSVPARFSQYAVYKDANKVEDASRAETPTTAGTMTNREWVSSSGRSSPLQPPRPPYVKDMVPRRSQSPLRIATSSFATQQEDTKAFSDPSRTTNDSPHSPQSMSAQAPLSSQNISPQPPRSPLPVPPSRRESGRESARYSHIARKAGITDMGMDISEEELLSTDFITEMLTQPVTPSPSAQFLRLPDSPRSPALSADDPHGLSRHIRGSEMRLAPESNLALASPGFAPMSVSLSERSVALEDIMSPRTPDQGTSALPSGEYGQGGQSPSLHTRSPIPSSIFPKGGDKIYLDQPSPMPVSPNPVSPNSQTLGVPENVTWGHGSPHPLVPSTPMSMDSFADGASPHKFHGFAQAQARHLSTLRKSSTSQSMANRLPIGPASGASPTTSTGGLKASLSSRVGSPRVRQHHYPRHGSTKPIVQTDFKQSPVTVVLQRAASAAGSTTSESKERHQTPTTEETTDVSVQVQLAAHVAESLTNVPGLANASPTGTQHDSLTVPPTPQSRRVPSHESLQSNSRLSESQTPSDYSYDSNYVSSDSVPDDEDDIAFDIVGQVQTASRVWDTTAPVIATTGNTTRPTVVGTATAVVIRSLSVDRGAGKEKMQERPHLDASSPTSGFELDVSAPASPRHPPSIDAPPSHHTDMPESAKSVIFSDEAHDGKERTYLPYDEVTGYGTNTFWEVNRDASSSTQASNNVPRRRPSTTTAESMKSVVSYITAKSRASTVASKATGISRKSTQSTPALWAWLKKKPLPPIPTSSPPSPNVLVDTHMNRDEPRLPVHQEQTRDVSPILEPGQYRRSKISLVGQGEPQGWNDITNEKWSPEPREDDDGVETVFYKSIGKFDMLGVDSLKIAKKKPSRRRDNPKANEASMYGPHGVSNFSDSQRSRFLRPPRSMAKTKPRKWICFVVMGVVTLSIILGTSLGLTLGHNHPNNSSTACGNNRTGARCNLDATCICPSSLSGVCAAPLAGALNALVPVTSQLFASDITSQGLALVIWESQGTPTTSNCAYQANLVDVGSVLDATVSPNRTEWAQAALLWNLFKSGDFNAVQSMQLAIARLPFKTLHSKDGIEADPSGQFSVTSSGFIFNFANQTVTAPSLSFKINGSPSSTQLSRLQTVTESALDRMYSFASASSTQQQASLSIYWQSVLLLSPGDLSSFLAAFKSAPIMLSFDATSSPGGQAISDLLTAAINRTLSFPPAIGCYPGLTSTQLQQINTVETTGFGLDALNATASTFDSTCFADRPVYGVLDVLRTRLPFSDSRSGVAKQAAVLTSDAASRVVLHVGEQLSALPGPANVNLTSFDVDPREFGTVSHLNHIALEWLQSFSTTALAKAAAQFVISNPSAPPPSGSSLFNATSLPIVEVAMFGDVFLSDFSSFSSSISTPSGSLFFGSSQAQAFRRWALQLSSSATIAWVQSTLSSQAVHEGSSSNTVFEEIWSAAGSLTAGPTNSSIVQEVVNALQSNGFFSS